MGLSSKAIEKNVISNQNFFEREKTQQNALNIQVYSSHMGFSSKAIEKNVIANQNFFEHEKNSTKCA